MFRFIVALLILRIKPSLAIAEPVVAQFRVKPWDLDLNIHLNNAKYLKYLDKGRVEHIIQCRPIRALYHQQLKLIVANIEISYLRSLMPFQKFTVSSRVTGWDHKYVYYEQVFESRGKRYATAIVRLALLRGQSTVSPIDVFRTMAVAQESPRLPESVLLLNQLIRAQREESSPATESTGIKNPDEKNTVSTAPVKVTEPVDE